jgi:hypothetical protein
MGGVGKSLLAEEYALRFSAAYPGGIFWLRALGNDATRPALTPDQQEAVRSDEFRNVGIQLGIDVRGLDSRQIVEKHPPGGHEDHEDHEEEQSKHNSGT